MQTAVTAYFSSKQLLLCVFVGQVKGQYYYFSPSPYYSHALFYNQVKVDLWLKLQVENSLVTWFRVGLDELRWRRPDDYLSFMWKWRPELRIYCFSIQKYYIHSSICFISDKLFDFIWYLQSRILQTLVISLEQYTDFGLSSFMIMGNT